MKYKVSLASDPQGRSLDFDRPEVLPKPGDKLIVLAPFSTLASVRYQRGDILELIERTNESPHGLVSSIGAWRVKCKYFTSVWTTIELGICQELLAPVTDFS